MQRFQKGISTYKCGMCGKLTRETGDGESYVDLCKICYEKAGDENSVADGCLTEQEYFERWNEHSVWYKEEVNA